MSAIKNGIKELHCKESLSGKRFKRSIAHNNLKLTCNIYHIQVLKLPVLQVGVSDQLTDSEGGRGGELSSLFFHVFFNSVSRRMLRVLHRLTHLRKLCLISLSCASCRGLRMAKRGDQPQGGGRGGGRRGGEVSVGLGCP